MGKLKPRGIGQPDYVKKPVSKSKLWNKVRDLERRVKKLEEKDG